MIKVNIPEAEREERSGDERRIPRIYVPFWIHDGIPYEAINLNGKRVFLYYEDGQFKIKTFIEERDGTRVFPIQTHDYEYEFQAVPEDLNIPSLKELRDEIFWFISNFFAHPDSRIYIYLTHFLIHTYILTLSIGTVFIWLVGRTETGKNTLQVLAEKIGYRSIGGVNPTEPAIYRTLGSYIEYGPLISIREYNFAPQFMRELAREGDKPNSYTRRVDEINGERLPIKFYIYGARIVGSNKLHGDEADMARYFIIQTMRDIPHLPDGALYQDISTKERLNRLRNNLLLWKLKNYQTISVPFTDPKGEFQGRVWDQHAGMIYLASLVSPEDENTLRGLIREYVAKRKEEENESSLPVLLLKIILEFRNEKHKIEARYRTSSEELWKKMQEKEEFREVYEGGVVVPNKLRAPDGRILTREKVAKILKEQLMATKETWYEIDENGKRRCVRGFSWDARLLERLRLSFGINLNQVESGASSSGQVRGGGDIFSESPSHVKDLASSEIYLEPKTRFNLIQPDSGKLGQQIRLNQVESSSSQKTQESRPIELVELAHETQSVQSISPPSLKRQNLMNLIQPDAKQGDDAGQLPPQEYVGALKPESSILTQTHEEKLPPYMENLIERDLISKNEDGSWSCRVCGKMRLKEFQAIWLHVVLCENSHKNKEAMKE